MNPESTHGGALPGLAHSLCGLGVGLLLPVVVLIAMYGLDHVLRATGLDHALRASGPHNTLVPLILAAPVPFVLGCALARTPLPPTLFRRFFPLLLPFLLLLTAAGPTVWWAQHSVRLLVLILAILGAAYLLCTLGFAWKSERRQASASRVRGLLLLCALLLLAGGSAGAGCCAVADNTLYDAPPSRIAGNDIAARHYAPFAANNLLAVPASPPTLRIAANHPRLDGSLALLPVYGAVAQAVYADLPESGGEADRVPVDNPAAGVVRCRNTTAAYQALIDGKVDLLFGMPPSASQLAIMKQRGLQPAIKPIAKEALVFFVHTDNPVRALSQERIRAVYARELDNWKQAGGADAVIVPFQCPEDSDSQTAMRRIVMRGQSMSRPLRNEYQTSEGDIINEVAAYRNWSNALGYALHWQAVQQFSSEAVRLLRVDGILPTPETVRNGDYPYIVPLVVVSCRPLSPESKELIDWITGPEGQDLIARTGYVPVQ